MDVLQQDGLTEIQRAVRDTLSEGGSKMVALLILGVLVGCIALTHWLTKKTNRSYAKVSSDPRGLFRALLGKLELTKEQKTLLEVTAKQAGIRHPSVLLLSPDLFDQHIEHCRKKLKSTKWRHRPDDFVAIADATRNALFAA